MLKNGAKGLKSSKWLLLACAVSAAVVDIIIIAMLIAGGEAGEYLACPFLLLIFDLIYLAVSLFFTNFRFKYSIGVWVSYVVLYAIGFSIGLAIILGGEGTVITNGALALWACVHAFNIVCAAVCALFASRIIKKDWLAFAVAAVFIVGAFVSVGMMISDGFFGQGKGKRTLVYSYDSAKGQYTVTGVLAGKSDIVSVPQTFNGKPVAAVSLKVFAERGVKSYDLPDGVTFTDERVLSRDMRLAGKKINVDKKSVNDFRRKFLEYGGENAVALANATLPANLEVNEGYVAFNYDIDSFEKAGGKTIPVYVGELDKFDATAYTADFDYVVHREDGSDFNYYWAYANGGYILSDIAGEGGSVFGRVIKNTVASVKFDRVYRIKVDNGNDKKYPMREKQPELCFDNVGGSSDYKYLTERKAGTLLDGLKPREGFTYRWQYYLNANSGAKPFIDLTEVLDDDITVSTLWELKNPTVTVSTSAADNTITYGDDVTLSSNAQHEAKGIKIEYEWFYEDAAQVLCSTQNVSLTHPKPSELSGRYRLRARVGNDEITSLVAFADAKINLKINPRRITFDWHLPEDRVYDGNIKNVSVSIPEGQEVEGHPLDYTFSGLTSFKDADTYNFSIVTNVITNKDYQVTNPRNSVTIQPRPAEVIWAGYENLEYNGQVQGPTATATGIASDGELSLNLSSGYKNAGTYTATATTSNKNYRLINATRPYVIAKKPLTITSKGVIVAYGKHEPEPVTVFADQCEGFVEGDGVASLSGTAMESYEGRDVGEYEGGVRIYGLTSNNYEITYVNGKLTIGKRIAQFAWSDTDNLVYDGKPKNVTAVVANKGYADDDIRLIITGGDAVNAGEHTAVAVIDPTCKDAENYSVRSYSIGGITYKVETEKTYTIKKAKIKITAQDKSSQYGEEFVELTARMDGTVYNDDEIDYSLSKQAGDNAGTYPINVTVAADNYDVQTVSGTYTITKRVAYVRWLTESQRNCIYDGIEHKIFTDSPAFYEGFLEKDLPYVTVTGYKATDAGDYVARVNLDSYIAGNYNLASPECEWKIEKTWVLFSGYINGNHISEPEPNACVGDAFTWSFANSQGKDMPAQCIVTVKYANQSSVTVAGGRYVFADAGEYEITITSNDKNCIESTKTWKVTVDLLPSEITYDTVFKGSLVTGKSEFTTSTGDTLRWQCNNTEGEFKVYYTYRVLNAAGADDAIRQVDGDRFRFSDEGVYNFTFTVAETSAYGAKTVALQVTVYAE